MHTACMHAACTPLVPRFGVFFGDSLYFYRNLYPAAKLLGFDSFIGLPAEKPGEVRRRGWAPAHVR